ncbi:hypothetical protein [uncultured Gammaproteobacteria bacterium]|jgi:ubiquinone/menaquinone biosynthesis C-methylase UbiE|nr:hypothetical protein [uncultured Gammaproteobacteria bacterium]CAC9501757.1 hypothetical protein [uncultured Gammaproteobacteria bacterium]CAC9505078.1 hypothetical protein [uncultured Gammaproteobacteria bacterium]CAC9544474.1 hypothetical protein [uncultured Gammaproteobacteria bacterium]CAC9998237.1 hypothetical protein [uncultured Gammaproteobacteria bacterium]
MNYDGYEKYDNQVAETYDIARKEEEHWKFENEYIKNRYKNFKTDRVLDLPVGTGRFLNYYVNVKEIFGCDISKDMLNKAKLAVTNSKENVFLSKEDAFNLSYADNYFDEIICFRLLHLIPPELRENLFKEFHRVLKGNLVLQVYLSRDYTLLEKVKNKIICFFNAIPNTKAWSHIKSYPLSLEELNRLINSVPMKVNKKNFLCQYTGADVYVFELSKD